MSSFNQEEDLKQAIAAAPSDPMPRLALADWYMEHDQDARGELLCLTTQLISEKVPMDDPRWDEQHALQRQFNEEIRAAMPTRLGEIICEHIENNPNNTTYDGMDIRGIRGYLNLSNIQIHSLPDNLHFGGDLFLYHTRIQSLPDNLHVSGKLNLSYTRIQSLPDNLHVSGKLNLSYTRIQSLPDNLQVGRELDFHPHQLSREEATRMLTLPGLSRIAKESGLKTLGYIDMLPLLDTPTAQVNGTPSPGQDGGIAH